MLRRTRCTLVLLLVFHVCGLLLLSHHSEAYDIQEYKKKLQLKKLPEFCAYVAGGPLFGNPEGDKYIGFFGKRMGPMHHYCWGLDKFNIAMENYANESEFKWGMASAINEFDYVIRNTNSKNILNPEIFTRKAITLSLIDRDDEAIRLLLHVIKKYPHYEHAYTSLSSMYSRRGVKDEARKVLESGLEHSPNSALLKQSLAKIQTR